MFSKERWGCSSTQLLLISCFLSLLIVTPLWWFLGPGPLTDSAETLSPAPEVSKYYHTNTTTPINARHHVKERSALTTPKSSDYCL